MDRILEPEIMDGEAEVAAYVQANFADSNQWCVNHFMSTYPDHLKRLVDLGCGPADIAIRLTRKSPGVHIVAVDGSATMLRFARESVDAAQLSHRIQLHAGRLPGLHLDERQFDALLSKDMLHHLPDPRCLWAEIRRLGRHGAAVHVMDLIRPNSQEEALDIVESVSADEHPILKRDFFNSLCAAFTIAEVRAQLSAAGLPLVVEQATSRHMIIHGLVG
jgi:ubiquinone/menaquinone biosynthesis C-methylase UbiE